MKKKTLKKDMSVNDLASMVAKGFAGVDKKFEQVDKKFEQIGKNFEQINKEIHELKELSVVTRRDVLDIGDRFVPRMEFDNLLVRFNRLEEKVRGKSK